MLKQTEKIDSFVQATHQTLDSLARMGSYAATEIQDRQVRDAVFRDLNEAERVIRSMREQRNELDVIAARIRNVVLSAHWESNR